MKRDKSIQRTLVVSGAILLVLSALSAAGNIKIGASPVASSYFLPFIAGAFALFSGLHAKKIGVVSKVDIAAFSASLFVCEIFAAAFGGYFLSLGCIRAASAELPLRSACWAGPVSAIAVSVAAGVPTLLNIVQYPEAAAFIALSAAGQVCAVAVFSAVLATAISRKKSVATSTVCSVLDYVAIISLFNSAATASIGKGLSPAAPIISAAAAVVSHVVAHFIRRKK